MLTQGWSTRLRRIIQAVLGGIAMVAVGPRFATAAEADLYVSPAGNDAWSGRHAQPLSDGTDGPLASPQRAQAALRAWRQTQPRPTPVTVLLRAGRYPLAQPLANPAWQRLTWLGFISEATRQSAFYTDTLEARQQLP